MLTHHERRGRKDKAESYVRWKVIQQSHMTVEVNQVHAFDAMKEDWITAIASLRQCHKIRRWPQQLHRPRFLKGVIKGDKAAKRQSTSGWRLI